MKTGRHHHRRGRGSRLAWVTSLTVHFFLLTFAVGAILPPVIPASEDLPVADRPLTIRWVPSQQATVRTEAEPPIEKEPLEPAVDRESPLTEPAVTGAAMSAPLPSSSDTPPFRAPAPTLPVVTRPTEDTVDTNEQTERDLAAQPMEPSRPPSRLVSPKRVTPIEPVYPAHCVRGGHEGTVLFSLEISATGTIESIEVLEPKPCHHLVAAARDAIADLRYEPARLGGIAVARATTLEVRFELSPE